MVTEVLLFTQSCPQFLERGRHTRTHQHTVPRRLRVACSIPPDRISITAGHCRDLCIASCRSPLERRPELAAIRGAAARQEGGFHYRPFSNARPEPHRFFGVVSGIHGDIHQHRRGAPVRPDCADVEKVHQTFAMHARNYRELIPESCNCGSGGGCVGARCCSIDTQSARRHSLNGNFPPGGKVEPGE